MLASEIDSLCAETAHSTNLPVEWVRHHVLALAGRPCLRCGGSGIVLPGACFRCRGTGGKASHVSVGNALQWVRSNVDKVRLLGEKRKAKAPSLAAARLRETILVAETWKRDHADLWEFLEEMHDNEFKRSLVQAVEAGRLTSNQEEAIQKMVTTKKQRETMAPLVGMRVDTRAFVVSALPASDMYGHRVFRVEFAAESGWRGRVDTTSEKVVDRLQGRRHDQVIVRGSVVWRRDGFAILSGQSEILLDG